ncbi:MAG: WYL domain-containing protein [Clostridia bacterium]|nr:WYL domain-containing protein [Clostridia bacterium]
MAKSENQKLKLIRLLEILMRHTDDEHGMDMAQIISALSEFGISAERKSVYADMDCLSELGFEVLKMTDARPPKYALVGRYFESAELKMLVDAIEAAKFIPQSKCREIVKKLELFAGKKGARDLARRVYVDDRSENRSILYAVDAIHTAINASVLVTFKYFKYNVEKKKEYHKGGARYRVSPLSLVWNDENYYLIAFDEDERIVKNFRVDKMESVDLTEEPRSLAALECHIDPGSYTRKVFGMYGGREELVVLECKDSLAGVIIDRFGKNVFFERRDGSFLVRLKITVSPNFFAWVSGFGKDMRIVAPTEVKDEFLSHVRAISELY